MYAEIYLRLEPLGLELVAAAARNAGHDVRIVDLQVFGKQEYFRELKRLAAGRRRVLAELSRQYAGSPGPGDPHPPALPDGFLFAGGHSASFVADEILAHAGTSLDCVVCGEGEAIVPQLLEAAAQVATNCTQFPAS